MPSSSAHLCLLSAAACAVAFAGWAPPTGDGGKARSGSQPEFQAVDQGVGDRTELSSSYRDMGVDLRSPMNFDRVYKVDARSRLLRGMQGFEKGAYARAHGGLVAVFPKGAYLEVAPGVDMAQVPPGTVYTFADSSRMSHVGEAKDARATRPGAVPLVVRIDAKPITKPADIPAHESAGFSIWSDETYRQRRVGQLLDWAERERAASAGPAGR